MGPPLRTAEFDIYFDSGIDDFGGWLQVMKAYKLIKQGGSWYTLTRQDGTEWKCTSTPRMIRVHMLRAGIALSIIFS